MFNLQFNRITIFEQKKIELQFNNFQIARMIDA